MEDKKKWSEEAERLLRKKNREEFAAEQLKLSEARRSKEDWTKQQRQNEVEMRKRSESFKRSTENLLQRQQQTHDDRRMFVEQRDQQQYYRHEQDVSMRSSDLQRSSDTKTYQMQKVRSNERSRTEMKRMQRI